MRFLSRVFAIYIIFVCIDLVMYMCSIWAKQQTENKYGYKVTHKVKTATPVDTVVNYNLFNTLFFEQNVFNVSTNKVKSYEDTKTIVLYNVPEYRINATRNDKIYQQCEYQNCLFTRNNSKLLTADAVIFYVGCRAERMGTSPPFSPKLRNSNQVWIFASNEPPEHYYNSDYQSTHWQNTMNWSSLYRLDSDIPHPYGCLIRKETFDERDYVSIYNAKTRNALWVVSHCHVASERRLFVKQMMQSGFDVDVIGGCSSNGVKISMDELETVIPMYKYFLAFENSFCQDYITEKFFRYYNFTWIIVVRGGADYRRLLPEKSYINSADFSNISSLVQYLTYLGNDKAKYIAFLRQKDNYFSIRWPTKRNCEICKRLNTMSDLRKTYFDVADYLTTGQCHRSTDL